jgi:hypothetical protein
MAMSPDTENKFTEGGDKSLSRYLKPDTPEIKKMKSLQGKEYKYSDYLGTMRLFIIFWSSIFSLIMQNNKILISLK